jgi:DeoR family fructose operon transcriptional repressor
MSTDFIPIERQERIVDVVDERGVVRVAELSRLFGVSEITIRRDLITLEQRGYLGRSHGGAVSRRRFQREPYFAQKGERNRNEKEAIGRRAALMIEAGETILVNSGSTNLELLKALPRTEIRIVTSNAGALAAVTAGEIECIVVGGVFRPRSNSFVGGLAVLTLEQVYGSKCFIGVDGVSLEAGLTTPHHQEAEIAHMMIKRTQGSVVVLADSSKIGGVSPFVTAPLSEVDVLVTDCGITTEYRSALEEHGLEVIVVDVDRE